LSITWRAAAAALEAATALCAALNLAYFLGRIASARPRPVARRLAAFILALVSAGALAESVLVLVVLSLTSNDTFFASAPWTAVRALAFAGTALISTLILRRIGNGK
jgi:hypothetical protein